jgi:hypothetical protein
MDGYRSIGDLSAPATPVAPVAPATARTVEQRVNTPAAQAAFDVNFDEAFGPSSATAAPVPAPAPAPVAAFVPVPAQVPVAAPIKAAAPTVQIHAPASTHSDATAGLWAEGVLTWSGVGAHRRLGHLRSGRGVGWQEQRQVVGAALVPRGSVRTAGDLGDCVYVWHNHNRPPPLGPRMLCSWLPDTGAATQRWTIRSPLRQPLLPRPRLL